MKYADLDKLKSAVELAVQQSTVANDVAAVEIEADSDEFGDEFLRVLLHTATPGKFGWHRIAPLVRAIEEKVAEVDDRFPSVRLAEAA